MSQSVAVTRARRCWPLVSMLVLASCYSSGGELIVRDGAVGPGPGGGGGTGGAGGMGGSDGGGNSGGSWAVATSNLAGLNSECGNMSYLSARPDRDMLIAGIAAHGLYAALDGATQFTPLGQGMSPGKIINRPTTIVYDPAHPDTFWESGPYSGGGVFRTTDNGATFVQLGTISHVDVVSIDFTDPDRKTLLAGSHEANNHLLLSTDGGANWTEIGPAVPAGAGWSSFPHVLDAKTFLLGTDRVDQPGIFRSTDGGATWTRLYSGGVRGAPLIASDGAFYWSANGSGVIKSGDHGVTWTKYGAMDAFATGNTSVVEMADGRIVSTGMHTLAVSSDKGVTWASFGPTLPYLPLGLVYSKFRKTFYAWRFDCTFDPMGDPVPADAIISFDASGL